MQAAGGDYDMLTGSSMIIKKEDFDLSNSNSSNMQQQQQLHHSQQHHLMQQQQAQHHQLGHGHAGLGVSVGMHTPSSYDGNNSNSFPAGSHTPHTTTQPHTPTPTTTTTPLKVEKLLQSPIARLDARKKERRKQRPNSLESSAESEASGMDVDPSGGNPGQVDAVSSTANFKSPLSALGMGDSNDANAGGCDKQVSSAWAGAERR